LGQLLRCVQKHGGYMLTKRIVTKLRKDLELEVCCLRRSDGLFEYSEKTGSFVIKISKRLSFQRKLSVLVHEIIHYLTEKGYVKEDDEKIASIAETIVEKAVIKLMKE